MFSSVFEISNDHEQDDLSAEVVNQHQGTKISVEFNRHEEPIGQYATHFRARVGNFVNTYVPISYKTWSEVDTTFKDDIWNVILKEFEVPDYLRKSIELSMPDTFRKKKCSLRKSHLDIHPTLEAKKMAIPPGIKKEIWEQFCINESDDKQIQFRAKAVESRKHSSYGHTGGRKSAAMIEHEMIAKRGGSVVPRTEVWIETHTRKDGSTLSSATTVMEQVKAKVSESSPSEDDNIRIHPLSIDEDPLTQVLGKKAKGSPGVGRLVSKRKYDAVLHSHVMHSEERNVKKGFEKKMDNIQKQFDVVLGCFKAQMTGGSSTPMRIPDSVHMSMPEKAHAPTRKETSKSSASLPATMSNACEPLLGEGDSATSTRIEPTPTRFCELLDWNKNVVAVAKEVTDPIHKDMCHNYRLNEHEMKVSICVRNMFSAKLYKETPDDKTIQEVGIGDFLVWPKVLIRFEEPVH